SGLREWSLPERSSAERRDLLRVVSLAQRGDCLDVGRPRLGEDRGRLLEVALVGARRRGEEHHPGRAPQPIGEAMRDGPPAGRCPSALYATCEPRNESALP